MANRYIQTLTVKRTGRTWGVYVNDRLVEGGFFSFDAAVECCKWWAANYREEEEEPGRDTGRYAGGYRTFRDGTVREDFGSDR